MNHAELAQLTAPAVTTTTTGVTIRGVYYLVESERPYEYQGHKRTEYTLRRPKGRRSYYAVRYENGTLSDVV